jgi:hypothetical protein
MRIVDWKNRYSSEETKAIVGFLVSKAKRELKLEQEMIKNLSTKREIWLNTK